MKGACGGCVWGWEMEGKTGRQHGFWLKNKHTHTNTIVLLFIACANQNKLNSLASHTTLDIVETIYSNNTDKYI